MSISRKIVQMETMKRKGKKLSYALRAFNDRDVNTIRRMYLAGAEIEDIANEFNRCAATVNKVITGKHPYTYEEDEVCLPFIR